MSLNQDNVLNEEDLSQSAFSNSPDSDDDAPAKKKKMSWLIFAAGGIVVVIFLAFVTWKMIAPHLQRNNDTDIGELQQVQQVNAQPVQETPSLPVSARPIGPIQPPPVPAGQAAQMTNNPAAAPVTGVTSTPNGVYPQTDSGNAQPEQSGVAAKMAAQSGVIAKLSADLEFMRQRVDRLEQTISTMDRNASKADKQTAQTPANQTQTPATETSKPAAKTATQHRPAVQPTRPANSVQKKVADATESSTAPKSDLHLKAVLDGRAWFQTKSGESITVAPGEEVKGLGTVKEINAEQGQVFFTNGNVAK